MRSTSPVGELLLVRGDPQLLRQVGFGNLLSGNAVKYSRGRADARIEVQARADGGHARFHVTDNGVGFDPSQSLRLFTIFSRLHGEDEFEGNGVGLAIVRRVVERHGGQVWAEGRPGKGATFGFSLPLAHPAAVSPPSNGPSQAGSAPPARGVGAPAPSTPRLARARSAP